MNADDVVVAQALADAASLSIVSQVAFDQVQALNEQLESALNTRIIIEQAKGMLAEGLSISPAEALVRLRDHARMVNQKLGVIANLIVTRELFPQSLQHSVADRVTD